MLIFAATLHAFHGNHHHYPADPAQRAFRNVGNRADRSNLTARAKQGNKAAAKALQLAQDPDRFLSTIQIGITLIGILTGIYSGEALAGRFGAMLASLGMPLRTAVP